MINNRFTNFLLAPRYRTARHLFLQFVVFMITVNILWNVPMRPLSFPQRLLGWGIYLFPLMQFSISIFIGYSLASC